MRALSLKASLPGFATALTAMKVSYRSCITALQERGTPQIGAALGLGLILASTALCSAVTVTWTGASGGDFWSDTANWQGGRAPSSGDEVVFGQDGGGDSILNFGLSLTALRFTPQILPEHDIFIRAPLFLTGFGIDNQSRIPGFGEPQNPPGVIRQEYFIDLGGTMTFQNSATVTGNLPVDLNARTGGRIVFEGNSSASGAPGFTATGLRAFGAASAGGVGGELRFKDDAKMGGAAGFVTGGGEVPGAQGGLTVFEGRAIASGLVTNMTGDGFGGRVFVQGNAVAGGSLNLANFGASHLAAGAEAVTQFLDDGALTGFAQNFAGFVAGATGGRTEFRNRTRFDGSAVPPESGSIQIINKGSFLAAGAPGPAAFGGSTVFYDDSRVIGTNVFIANNTETESPNPGGLGGTTEFLDRSRAGGATITNAGTNSTAPGTLGGRTFFRGDSSAESANIIAGGGFALSAAGGLIEFSGNSTAANATLTALQGANGGLSGGLGGTIILRENANGAVAKVVMEDGIFDMSGLTSAGTTLGSIEGSGTFFLGSKALTVGSNGLDTETIIALRDGGQGGGVGATLTKVGTGRLTLGGNSTYTGTTTVSAGVLLVEGSLGAGAVMVAGLATLTGFGTVGGAVTVADDGRIAPEDRGFGTLTVGALSLSPSSNIDFDLRTAGTIGGGINDLLEVNGALAFDGVLNVGAPYLGLTLGTYRLINYTGQFTDNGVTIGTVPAGTRASEFTLQTNVAGQVNLVFGGDGEVLFWDGAQTASNNFIEGGTGTWNNAATNWTDSSGAVQRAWNGRTAVFAGTAGTVTLGESVSTRGMQFATTGYVVSGSAGTAITLDGAVQFRADPAVSVTISAPLTGAGSLNKTGTGTLTLTGDSSYTGGTTITDGEVIVRNAAGLAFGTGPVAVLASPTSQLSFRDNASAGLVTFTNAGSGPAGDAGVIGFTNTARAGTATLINLGNVGDTGTGGTLRFDSSSRANASTIENRGAGFSSPGAGFSGGGQTFFSNSASAETATITNFSGLAHGLQGGRTVFTNSASANTATITNRGGTVAGALGGSISFTGSARAGSAILIAESGTNGGLGGVISFSGTSAGESARVILGTGGSNRAVLDISGMGGGGIVLGSLEGGGNIFLGRAILSVGTNSLSTEFSGSISDGGGSVNGVGGSFIKGFPGTLTFSGENSYTGSTTVLGGVLALRGGGRLAGNAPLEVLLGSEFQLFDSTSIFNSTVSNDGGLKFFDTSLGGTATITNRPPTVGGSTLPRTIFAGQASADRATITNLATGTANGFGAASRFLDTASAGSATITNNGSSQPSVFVGTGGGATQFSNNSTAGVATITNGGGTVADSYGGITAFVEGASAGTASIINLPANGGAGAGRTTFQSTSTAADAVIHNRGASLAGAQGGFSQFSDLGSAPTAGRATIINFGGLAAANTGGGFTVFNGTATSGASTIFNRRGAAAGAQGGRTTFQGMSVAGTSVFTNEGAQNGSWGFTEFRDSSNAQQATFFNGASFPGFGGRVNFLNTSKAGAATFDNEGGKVASGFGGEVFFLGNSSADASTITNRAKTVANAFSGGVGYFYQDSKGGTATIINEGSAFGPNATRSGGWTEFSDGASAEQATIVNEGPLAAGGGSGETHFNGNVVGKVVTADRATITNKGGLFAFDRGGLTLFSGTATAGMAQLINSAGRTTSTFGGATTFLNTAKAGAATFTNEGAHFAFSIGGATTFQGSSSAGTGTFTNGGGTAASSNGGRTVFHDGSTAGSGIFINEGGTVADSGRSVTFFDGTASAGNATITSKGGAVAGALGGITQFRGGANGGSATITAEGGNVAGGGGGITQFTTNSNAGSALLVVHGGSNGGSSGLLEISESASGGTARVIANMGGTLDISRLTVAGTTIGSIEGAGNVLLGSKRLTVGGNNRSEEFSGAIADGSQSGGTGGMLTQISNGSLTLSGANTYTGGTIIGNGFTANSGKLIAANLSGSATGTGPVTVRRGGTLSGSGFIGGPVFLQAGGTIAPGDPVTLTLEDNLTWDSGSVIRLALGPNQAGSDLLDIQGALLRGDATGSAFVFELLDFGAVVGQTYDFLQFASIQGFSASDFTFSGDVEGNFAVHGDAITFTATAIIPEPGTVVLLACSAAFLCCRRHR